MPIPPLQSADKSSNMLRLFGARRRKWQAIISFVLLSAIAVADAEDSPWQSPTPSSKSGEMEEPALPTAEAAPSNSAPGLLPESGELPASPPAESWPKLKPVRGSAQAAPEREGRFDEIRSLAMSNPRATYLLKRARSSSSSASRRTYFRAYYITVASRMRKLDPKLKSSIDAYEEAKMHEVSGARNLTARASHRARLHRTAHLSVHHRLHRVSFENRYRRIIIIDGPYGPDFPPYGPPVVFDPW
jgi:hypothetical protein